MGLATWLLGLLGEEAAASGARRGGRFLVGDQLERALERSVQNACQVVAQEATTPGDSKHVAAVLIERVGGVTPVRLPAGTALEDIEAAISEAVGVLWTETVDEDRAVSHADEIGLTCTHETLVRRLVDELITSLGLAADAISPIGTLVALLGTARNRRDIEELRHTDPTLLIRAGSELQATRVNAWISVNEEVPIVYVMNDSDAPVTDVRPTPALIGYDERGEITAQVGHSPLGVVRQIDPHSGWAWRMDHCPWGGAPYIKGQVHVHFQDAAGRDWLLAQGRLVLAQDPWAATPPQA